MYYNLRKIKFLNINFYKDYVLSFFKNKNKKSIKQNLIIMRLYAKSGRCH